MLFRLLPVPLCVMKVCYACQRSAESKTLKVHPVASKTLTQKRPVYAAPKRLVGDFSFSIVYFLGTVTCEYPEATPSASISQNKASQTFQRVMPDMYSIGH